MTQQSSAASSNIWVSGRRASRDRISARHLRIERSSTDQNRRCRNGPTTPFPTSPELLNKGNTPNLPECRTELALRRRLELIAQQFTTKLAPIAPRRRGAGDWNYIMSIARSSARVPAPVCAATTSAFEFAPALIRLSVGRGAASGLARGQGPGEAIHAGAAG